MRGERARIRPEDHLADNPGQLSPGRPDLLTSPVERCRSRPARTPGRAEPACTTWGEKTRVTGTATAPRNGHRPGAEFPMPRIRRTPAPAGASRSKTPDQNLFTRTTTNTPEPLDTPLLTLVISSPHPGVFAVGRASNWIKSSQPGWGRPPTQAITAVTCRPGRLTVRRTLAELTATVTATAATNGRQRRSAAARDTPTIRANS